MKKILLAFGALAILAGLSSCGTKLCYCFERVNDEDVYRSEIYVDQDTPCSTRSTDYRGCIEREELGSIDPEDIVK
jgi:hypothetical protein